MASSERLLVVQAANTVSYNTIRFWLNSRMDTKQYSWAVVFGTSEVAVIGAHVPHEVLKQFDSVMTEWVKSPKWRQDTNSPADGSLLYYR